MRTILIVDDDRDVRSMMKLALRTSGHKILEAEDGIVAHSLAIAKKPDLIISDVMMDNANGFMFCEMLRRDPVTAHIPIILVTGAAQGAGAWESDKSISYLQKPISMTELLHEVHKRLSPYRRPRPIS